MPFTVYFHGTPVICDTITEAKSFIADGDCGPQPVVHSVHPPDTSEIAMALNSLSPQQRKFVRLLANRSPRPVSDEDARADLKLANNKQLAGTLAGIAKRFKAAKLPNVVLSNIAYESGARIHSYRINEDGMKALEDSGLV